MSPKLFVTLSTVILIFVITTADAAAQDPARTRPEQPPTQPAAPRTSADEEFDLNITERRINEADYAASTALEAGGANGLTLRVGVALGAAEIDVMLRNVRGHVRFRGSLEAVLRRLNLERREAPPPAPAPPQSTPSP